MGILEIMKEEGRLQQRLDELDLVWEQGDPSERASISAERAAITERLDETYRMSHKLIRRLLED